MEPRRSNLAPGLERWLEVADDVEARTVVVRLPSATDPERAAEAIRGAGATVQTVGRTTVTCVVTPDLLRTVAGNGWVAAIEEPRRMFPRAQKGL